MCVYVFEFARECKRKTNYFKLQDIERKRGRVFVGEKERDTGKREREREAEKERDTGKRERERERQR